MFNRLFDGFMFVSISALTIVFFVMLAATLFI